MLSRAGYNGKCTVSTLLSRDSAFDSRASRYFLYKIFLFLTEMWNAKAISVLKLRFYFIETHEIQNLFTVSSIPLNKNKQLKHLEAYKTKKLMGLVWWYHNKRVTLSYILFWYFYESLIQYAVKKNLNKCLVWKCRSKIMKTRMLLEK